MTIEELNKQFKSSGFKIDGDRYIMETEQYTGVRINDVPQKQKVCLELQYVGEGSIRDSGDSEEGNPLFQFDVIQNNKPVLTICAEDFDGLMELL